MFPRLLRSMSMHPAPRATQMRQLPKIANFTEPSTIAARNNEMKQLIKRGDYRAAIALFWSSAFSPSSIRPNQTSFTLLFEAYGMISKSYATAVGIHWQIMQSTELPSLNQDTEESKPDRLTLEDGDRIITALNTMKASHFAIDLETAKWVFLSLPHCMPVAVIEADYFAPFLDLVLQDPDEERCSETLELFTFGCLDRDFISLPLALSERCQDKMPPRAAAAIVSWFAESDNLDSALSYLQKMVQISPKFAGTTEMYSFLFRLCKRKRLVKQSSELLSQMIDREVYLSAEIFNLAIDIRMENGDVEGAVDTFEDMIAKKVPPNEETRRILGDTWLRYFYWEM